MNVLQVLLVIATSAIGTNGFISKLKDMYINDFHVSKCNPADKEAVSMEDLEISIGDHHNVHVSGSLIVSEDLLAPIKTEIVLKRSTWFGWLKIGCIDDVGSCTFLDICKFGYPTEEPCPQNFRDNEVPCRCPINKGNYTLPPTMLEYMNERSVLAGKYKGSVLMTHLDNRLACYNMYFTLQDKKLVKNA